MNPGPDVNSVPYYRCTTSPEWCANGGLNPDFRVEGPAACPVSRFAQSGRIGPTRTGGLLLPKQTFFRLNYYPLVG